VRLFFAIDLPSGERERLAALIPGAAPGIRRVPADRMHLTLRFVGHVTDDTRESLIEGLSGLSLQEGTLRLRGVGTFPARGKPRVLWAGVDADEVVRDMRDQVEALCRDKGLDDDPQPWSPHVTLGRFKAGRPPWLTAFMAAHAALESDPVPATEVVLYDSIPAPPSVAYEALAVRRAD